jgi:hypothetical protein
MIGMGESCGGWQQHRRQHPTGDNQGPADDEAVSNALPPFLGPRPLVVFDDLV